MEVPGAGNNKFWVLWSEFLGTAFLLVAVNWGGTSLNTPICVGLTVMALAQIFGQISGGHFNPAVTVGMMIKHRHDNVAFNVVYGQMIIVFQILGALAGCLFCTSAFVIFPQDDSKIPSAGSHYITQLCPVNGCNDGGKLLFKVFLVEVVMTFFFVSFVLQIVKHSGAKDMPVNAMCIGIALYAAIQIASGISGGAINPAVGLAQPFYMKIMNGHAYPNAPRTAIVYFPMYMFGSLIGGVLAGGFSRYIVETALARGEAA